MHRVQYIAHNRLNDSKWGKIAYDYKQSHTHHFEVYGQCSRNSPMVGRIIAAIRSSIRAKLILATIIVGLAFIGLSIGYLLTLQIQAHFFESALQETTTELFSVAQLEKNVNHVADVYNDFIADPTGSYKKRLISALNVADAQFNKTLKVDFDDRRERERIKEAHTHWHHSSVAVQSLLKEAPGGEAISSNRADFDHHFEETIFFLYQINDLIKPELAEQMESARSITSNAFYAAAAVMMLALSLTVTAITLVTRWLLNPLNRFTEAAAHLGRRDFSYRLKLERHDEFGALADAFNSMSDQLGKNQAILEAMATHDDLTGLNNRREFFRLIDEEFKRSTRYDHSFSLLMIDIDHFKAINDRYGHKAGDNALQAVALLILKQLRPIDHVARYGGDEIAVILPETRESAAFQTAERICRSICAQKIRLTEDISKKITISAGVAGFPDGCETTDQLLITADKALYKAKKAGRGRVCGYEAA